MNTLFWILIIGFGVWWFYRMASRKGGGGGAGMSGGCCGGGHSHHGSHSEHGTSHKHSKSQQVGEMVVDPVCKMAVDKDKIDHTLEYGGTTYYFCSNNCYQSFKADPEGYLLNRQTAN